MSEYSLKIKYWGVRGSIPAPITSEEILEKQVLVIKKLLHDGLDQVFSGKVEEKKIREYLQSLSLPLCGTYGGDTTCIEIQAKDSPLIIIDAGTGIRRLGKQILGRLFSKGNVNPLNSTQENTKDLHLFFTHYHWDHIQGFPFFGPAFLPGDMSLNFYFYGKKDTRIEISEVLRGQQRYPNFPVVWEDMPCKKEYRALNRFSPEHIKLGKLEVGYQELTHPDSIFAYSFLVDGKKFVCATDTEHKDSPDPRLVNFAKNADILYYDSQYTPEEYLGTKGTLTGAVPKFDWGHSTYEWAIRNALAANVALVVLGHHEPLRDDMGIYALNERALEFRDSLLKLPENKGKKLEVVMASQDLEHTL